MLSVSAQTLLAATVLVLLIACVLWSVFAFGLKLQPRASKGMAAANLLLAAALLLSGLPGELEQPWLSVYAADLAGTAAFALLSLVPAWMGEERPPWRWSLALVALALLLMPGFLLGWPMRWHGAVLYGIQAPLLGLAAWQSYRLVRSRTRQSFSLALSLPLGAMTLLLVARAIEPLLWPGNTPDLRSGSGFNVAWLWAGLVLGMVVNSVVAFLLLAQLILRIRNLTLFDPLTAALNRRAMGCAMEQAHARWRRGEPYALVLLDMDHFKSINDSLGHGAGDLALKGLVAALKPCVRDADALGRWGGEEFLILLCDTGLAGAALVAERMRSNLEAQPLLWRGDQRRLTASFGIAEVLPGDDSPEAVLTRADQGLYQAKRQGRNLVQSRE
ncbi:GGDEF domain-containing protein [Mitsuaria sp. WAJ17]|uniref:GGDEF domain-containing protein n=1 Tax=Mitsuaria sp. WAJ17 TaxID=2761452 RepID=UPI0016027CA8|nr:GGDEF domain-containing protein [Mitsuaria sp. WAJ17]MBB2487192.1 GGDEF domain-containing protein [Mitsuaria sp. WAJ17]